MTDVRKEKGAVLFYGGILSSFCWREIWLPPAWHGCEQEAPIRYVSREEYFQSAKARTEADHDQVLGGRPDNWEVKKRGRGVDLRPDWDVGSGGMCYSVMLTCVRHEVLTDPELRAFLELTGDRWIAEDSPTDAVWGIVNGGMNLLGLCWMQVRHEMRGGKHFASVAAGLGWINQADVYRVVGRAADRSWLDAPPRGLRPHALDA